MFLERLSNITGRIDGAVALSLVAADGIPVESVNSDPSVDLEVLAAELIAQVRVISDDHRELNVGEVRHLAVTTDKFTLMVSGVAAGYYLLLVMADSSSFGRARFELRRARLLFEPDLS
jgi:predicted regulator of Ras-like GTPase activity (Roadblock/LC7/MglB family)